MFCSYSPVYRDASGFAIAFSGDRRFRSPSPKTNQGRIAKCAQKPVTIRRGGARPSRQQKTRIKKMFGDFADCANSPNIFSHMAWPRREGTRPSPTRFFRILQQALAFAARRERSPDHAAVFRPRAYSAAGCGQGKAFLKTRRPIDGTSGRCRGDRARGSPHGFQTPR